MKRSKQVKQPPLFTAAGLGISCLPGRKFDSWLCSRVGTITDFSSAEREMRLFLPCGPRVSGRLAASGVPPGRRPGLPVWARGGRIALPAEAAAAAAAAAPAVRWWGFSARRREAGRPRLPVGGRARIWASESVRVRECVSAARRVFGCGFRLLPCRRCSRCKSM